MAKWYVYKLMDPRNGETFYIGKGTGKRIEHHEAEAARGVCSHKCNKINVIRNSGLAVIKQKIALFWCEQSAYDLETDLIDSIGLDNLTNVMRGGAGGFEKRVKEYRARNAKSAPPFMTTMERAAPRFAEWIVNRHQYKNSQPSAYLQIVVDTLDKYLPKFITMGMKENPEKMREIFAPYGIGFE